MSGGAKKKSPRVQINNKRASFDYEFLEQYDAGIVLVGTEIKSLRRESLARRRLVLFFRRRAVCQGDEYLHLLLGLKVGQP